MGRSTPTEKYVKISNMVIECMSTSFLDEFVGDGDLLISCMSLQKQIDHIQGSKDNIIVPSVRMRAIRDGRCREQTPITQPFAADTSEEVPEKVQTSSVTSSSTSSSSTTDSNQLPDKKSKRQRIDLSNPCVLCNQEERQLACIPCGHLCACITCSQSLRTCPTCHRDIQAFVRVYVWEGKGWTLFIDNIQDSLVKESNFALMWSSNTWWLLRAESLGRLACRAGRPQRSDELLQLGLDKKSASYSSLKV